MGGKPCGFEIGCEQEVEGTVDRLRGGCGDRTVTFSKGN